MSKRLLLHAGIFLFSIVFLCWTVFEETEAKWIKIRSSSISSITSAGLKASMKQWVRSYSSYSNGDIALCSDLSQRHIWYLCGSDSRFSSMPDFWMLELENRINEMKGRLEQSEATVNQYNRASVNQYNALVSTYNWLIAEHKKLVEEHNSALQQECVSYSDFCKPYDCEKKRPGTSYDYTSNSCICSNGNAWNSNLQCGSAIETKADNGVDSVNPSTEKSDNTAMVIFWVVVIWGIFFWLKK